MLLLVFLQRVKYMLILSGKRVWLSSRFSLKHKPIGNKHVGEEERHIIPCGRNGCWILHIVCPTVNQVATDRRTWIWWRNKEWEWQNRKEGEYQGYQQEQKSEQKDNTTQTSSVGNIGNEQHASWRHFKLQIVRHRVGRVQVIGHDEDLWMEETWCQERSTFAQTNHQNYNYLHHICIVERIVALQQEREGGWRCEKDSLGTKRREGQRAK